MTVSPDRVRRRANTEALAEAAAAQIEALAAEATGRSGRFSIAFAGGSTPRELYAQLAKRNRCNWSSWWIAVGDERVVPSDHPESNAGMVCTTLLDRVGIPVNRRILPPVDESLTQAEIADRYDQSIRSLLAESDGAFDLVLLGLGADGHTASLFPGDTRCLTEMRRTVCAAQAPPEASVRERITLTYPVLLNARAIIFLVAGAGKRAVIGELLAGRGSRTAYPASRFVPNSRTYWYLDSQAAAGLPIAD